MKEVYGTPPLVGYTMTLEEMQTDYEVYKMLYAATSNGTTMTKDQLDRFTSLTKVFEDMGNE